MRNILGLIFLLSFIPFLSAADYFVDAENGNDNAEGVSPETAWSSLARVNGAKLVPGDRVLFRRGSVWRGHLQCRAGNADAPITYGAYGTGRLPAILSSVNLADSKLWVPPADPAFPVWSTKEEVSLPQNVGNVILTPRGKLPADPAQFYTDDTNRKAGWKRWKLEDLKEQDDFWYDYETKRLFFRSAEPPAERYEEIEAALDGAVVAAESFVTLDSLAIGYGGGHGVAGSPAQCVTIRGCDIFWIGGSELRSYRTPNTRYGNGVEFWDRGENHLVEGNSFRQIYDTAMTIQGPSDSIYRNIVWRGNKVDRCEQSFEIWLTSPVSEIQQMIFEKNDCTNAGFGWGHDQRPNKNGTHLLGYNLKAKTVDVTIRENSFRNGRDALVMYWNGRLGELNIDQNIWGQQEQDGVAGIDQPVFIWGLGEKEKHKETFEKYRELTGNDKNSTFE